jgi:hypothetical protein
MINKEEIEEQLGIKMIRVEGGEWKPIASFFQYFACKSYIIAIFAFSTIKN